MKLKSIAGMILTLTLAASLAAACGQKNAAPTASPNKAQGGGATASPSPSPSLSPSATTARKTYTAPPEMKIDTSKAYTADFDTSKGKFTIQLFAKEAPKTVNNFVFLANDHFYDGVIFHRIMKTFMIQTGDPLGNGTGGPGYKFEDELKTGLKYDPGIVAMANSGQNTNGSQFFICTGDDCGRSLNSRPNYSIFGKVTDGMDVVQKIAETPVKANPMTGEPSAPAEKVTINSIKINVK